MPRDLAHLFSDLVVQEAVGGGGVFVDAGGLGEFLAEEGDESVEMGGEGGEEGVGG